MHITQNNFWQHTDHKTKASCIPYKTTLYYTYKVKQYFTCVLLINPLQVGEREDKKRKRTKISYLQPNISYINLSNNTDFSSATQYMLHTLVTNEHTHYLETSTMNLILPNLIHNAMGHASNGIGNPRRQGINKIRMAWLGLFRCTIVKNLINKELVQEVLIWKVTFT